MEGSKVEVSEVGEMMTEVSKVITSHLYKLVNKFEEDKKNMVSTVEILKKLPIIKELEDKLKTAEEENAKLRSKIKELLASSSQSKKITLQTEEINESEKPVSYSEIDALVETQVKNKDCNQITKSVRLQLIITLFLHPILHPNPAIIPLSPNFNYLTPLRLLCAIR